jgi:hypothetical protein
MTQLTIDLSEQEYRALQSEAIQRKESIEEIARKYLSIARMLSRGNKPEPKQQWPEGYFEVFGGWQGSPLERPDQGKFEERLDFE